MKTSVRHIRAPKRSASEAPTMQKDDTSLEVPDMATVARRLSSLSAVDMPWLRRDVDLTPQDGGPEVFGPPTFSAAKLRD